MFDTLGDIVAADQSESTVAARVTTDHVGYYCGRFDPGFLGEPLNAPSNIVFILMAALAFRTWKRAPARDWAILVLIVSGAAVGIGSFIFHTHPTRVTLQIDLIPVEIFGLLYVGFAARRFFGARPIPTVVAVLAFFFLTLASNAVLPAGLWGGGVRHLPSLVALLLCGTWFATRGMSDGARRTGKMLWQAAGLLAAGLLFRSVDLSLCDAFPHGVHWVWHVFTGCTLGVLLFAAIGHSSSAKSITP